MGGGHVSRPDFGLSQIDQSDPMTEFYLFLEDALNRAPAFALPGAYVAFQPPIGQNLYADTIRTCCTFSGVPQPGYLEIFPPSVLHLHHEELHLAAGGAPAALMLTSEQGNTIAVQLSPPAGCPGATLPPLPENRYTLCVRLQETALLEIDDAPARLRRCLLETTDAKMWLTHPRIEQWLAAALGAAQRAYHKEYGP